MEIGTKVRSKLHKDETGVVVVTTANGKVGVDLGPSWEGHQLCTDPQGNSKPPGMGSPTIDTHTGWWFDPSTLEIIELPFELKDPLFSLEEITAQGSPP